MKTKRKTDNVSIDLARFVDRANWPDDLNKAKAFAQQAFKQFQWKEKIPQFLSELDRADTVEKVQQLVIYPLLSGEGLQVIKF